MTHLAPVFWAPMPKVVHEEGLPRDFHFIQTMENDTRAQNGRSSHKTFFGYVQVILHRFR